MLSFIKLFSKLLSNSFFSICLTIWNVLIFYCIFKLFSLFLSCHLPRTEGFVLTLQMWCYWQWGWKQQNSVVRVLLVKPECNSKRGSLNIALYACSVLCQKYIKLVLKDNNKYTNISCISWKNIMLAIPFNHRHLARSLV